jgi:hypothetical protein
MFAAPRRLADRRVGVGLVCLAIAPPLAACGRAPHKVALPLSTTPPACSTVPAATVNRALGTNVSEPTASPGTGGRSNIETCTYAGGAGVTLYYEVGPTLQAFRKAQSSVRNATSVSGLGAAAYSHQSSTSDPRQHKVVALFGTLEVSVTADASVSAEVSLLKIISSQL